MAIMRIIRVLRGFLWAALAGAMLANTGQAQNVPQYAPDEQEAAAPDDKATCFQLERAHEAFSACTRMLIKGQYSAPERVRIYERRAHAQLVLFYFAEAAEDYSEVLNAEPDNVAALEGRGEALSEDGQFAEAAKDWARITELRGDDISALINLGKNHFASGNFDASIDAYQRASKADAKNVMALVGLGRAYDAVGKLQESDVSLAEALNIKPNSIPALMARAEIAERRGNIELAIESYSLSLKANGMQVKPRKALQRLGIETPP